MSSRQFVVHYINEQNIFLFLVQILALFVRTMMQPEIRERLILAKGPDAIWSVLREAFGSQRVIRPIRQRR